MKKISGIYAIADSALNPCAGLPMLIEKFLIGGCRLIQLRVKKTPSLWDEEAYETAKDVMRFKKDFDFIFIINDYVDVAAEVFADGVHVGKNDLSVGEIRGRVKKPLIIGYSSHSFEEAESAEKAGADYVALGAVYPTSTKGPGHPIVGIETLKKVSSALKVPVVAIGGIKRENIKEVFSAGAKAAAMITALSEAHDIAAETKWFVQNANLK